MSAEQCRACPGRLAADAASLLGSTVNELLPPEAQVHLWNAQKELLLALTITLDHHMRTRRDGAQRRESRRPVRVELE